MLEENVHVVERAAMACDIVASRCMCMLIRSALAVVLGPSPPHELCVT